MVEETGFFEEFDWSSASDTMIARGNCSDHCNQGCSCQQWNDFSKYCAEDTLAHQKSHYE